jgi:hypothetical protein
LNWSGSSRTAAKPNIKVQRFWKKKKKRFASVVSLARSLGTRYLEIERKISSSKDGRKLNKKLKCKKMFVVLLCCAPNKIDFCLPR